MAGFVGDIDPAPAPLRSAARQGRPHARAPLLSRTPPDVILGEISPGHEDLVLTCGSSSVKFHSSRPRLESSMTACGAGAGGVSILTPRSAGDRFRDGIVGPHRPAWHRWSMAASVFPAVGLITDEVPPKSRISAAWRRSTTRTTQGIPGRPRALPGVPQVAVFDTAFHRRCRAMPISTRCPMSVQRHPGAPLRLPRHFRIATWRSASAPAPGRFGNFKLITCHLATAVRCAPSTAAVPSTPRWASPAEGLNHGTRTATSTSAALLALAREGLTWTRAELL